MARKNIELLSDAKLRALVAAGNPIAKSDGGGLTFTLSANGTAAWVLRYYAGGRRKEVTLGRYPDLTLKAARAEARAQRVNVERGADPATEKQRRKVAAVSAWTVRQLVKDYCQKVLPTMAPSTAKGAEGYANNDLAAQFGARIARDLTEDDAQAWLGGIAEARSYHAAANARKVAIQVFKHGKAMRVVGTNPFDAIKMSTVAARPNKRQGIALRDDELAAFLRGMDALPEADALALKILLATGVRIGEMLSAEWADLDLENGEWHIPRAKIKTRKHMRRASFDIELPDIVTAWFLRLQVLGCGSHWVLPARAYRGSDKPLDHEAFLTRLGVYTTSLGDACRAITPHDTRSTMRSHLSSQGVRWEVAERALNHKLGGLTEVYDQNDYRQERADALNAWASKLVALGDSTGKVVPIRRNKAVA